MMMPADRDRVVAEAERWINTPHHNCARVLGAGVDCGQLLIAAYVGAGLVEPFETGQYPADWMLHMDRSPFLELVERYMVRVEKPGRGDVAIWKIARTYAHGAIVIDWPNIIHAYKPDRRVAHSDASKGRLSGRSVLFYTLG